MIHKPETKEILAESLKELLTTKTLEHITVQDIAENCQISRATFYRNFKDKYELSNWIYRTYIEAILKRNPEIDGWKSMLLQAISFQKENQNYFAAIWSFQGQNSFQDFLFNFGREYCWLLLKKLLGTEKLDQELLVAIDIYIAGTERVISDWVQKGCNGSPKDFTQILCECMPSSLQKYFKI